VYAPEKSEEKERVKDTSLLERVLHDNASVDRRLGLVIRGSFLDLAQTKFEDLGDVDIGLCTRLDPGSVIVFG